MIIDGREYDELGDNEFVMSEKGGGVKTVTGKEVFEFLSLYWQAIYNGIPDQHRWRWDRFVTMIGLYRDTAVEITNTELVNTLNGLADLELIPQSAVDDFLG